MDRLTAVGCAGVRKVLARVAPHDFDALPRHVEELGGDASRVDDRMRSKIADAGLHVQLSVGPDRDEAVVPDRIAADERTHRDADTANLRAAPFGDARLAFVPLEERDAAIDRLPHERAR